MSVSPAMYSEFVFPYNPNEPHVPMDPFDKEIMDEDLKKAIKLTLNKKKVAKKGDMHHKLILENTLKRMQMELDWTGLVPAIGSQPGEVKRYF